MKFQVSKNIASKILKDTFSLRPNAAHNLQHQPQFAFPQMKIVYNRTETASFIGPKYGIQFHQK